MAPISGANRRVLSSNYVRCNYKTGNVLGNRRSIHLSYRAEVSNEVLSGWHRVYAALDFFFFRGRPPSLPFSREDFAFFGLVRLPSNRAASEIASLVTMWILCSPSLGFVNGRISFEFRDLQFSRFMRVPPVPSRLPAIRQSEACSSVSASLRKHARITFWPCGWTPSRFSAPWLQRSPGNRRS